MACVYFAERERFADGADFIGFVFHSRYGFGEIELRKTPNGKPCLSGAPHEISLSHTKTHLFLAVSDRPVGIDAEPLDREIDYAPVLKKFSPQERELVKNRRDFLALWTAKESVVKLFGGTLAHDLKKIVCDTSENKALYGNIPVYLKRAVLAGHIVALAAKTPLSLTTVSLCEKPSRL